MLFYSTGYFIEPTVIETKDPANVLMCEVRFSSHSETDVCLHCSLWAVRACVHAAAAYLFTEAGYEKGQKPSELATN